MNTGTLWKRLKPLRLKMGSSRLREFLSFLPASLGSHAGGIVGDYRYGDEIEKIVNDFDGITISDEGFIEKSIHIEKGAIEAIAIKTQLWIVDFIEECRVRLKTTIGV